MMLSVCLATYNGELFVKEQISSILPQLGRDDELIVSDDDSEDKTSFVVSSFDDTRIKFVKNRGKKGVIGNFENAISIAKGDYIFLSDQDDVWLPTKVQVALSKIEELEKKHSNQPIMVFSDATVVDENLQTIIPSIFGHTKEDPSISGSPEILSVANRILGCTIVFNKKAKEISLPIPDYAVMHDWWIALNVAKCGIIEPIYQPTILYRQHKGNVVGAEFLKTKNRLLQIKHLWQFNRKIYRMTSLFFKMNALKYIVLKIRLHIK